MGIKNCYYNVYSDDNSKRTKLNPWRLLQFILACGCFAVTIFLVNNTTKVFDTVSNSTYSTYYIPIAASSIICILTLLDLIGMLYGNAFYWTTWLLIVTFCIILAILCIAVLVMNSLILIILIAMVLFLLLAIVFIIDLICLVCYVTHRKSKRNSISSSIEPRSHYVDHRTYSEVGTSTELDAMQPSTILKHDEPEHVKKCGGVCNRGKSTSQTSSVAKTTSYGGTFPMSKNELPLPSPCSRRPCPKKTGVSTTSVPDRSEKSQLSSRSQSLKDLNSSTVAISKKRCGCGSKSDAVSQKSGSKGDSISQKSGSKSDAISQSGSPSKGSSQKTQSFSRRSSSTSTQAFVASALTVKNSVSETCNSELDPLHSPRRGTTIRKQSDEGSLSRISQRSSVSDSRKEKQSELSPRSQSIRPVKRGSISRNGLDYTGSERPSSVATKSDDEADKELVATASSRTVNLSDNNNNWNREQSTGSNGSSRQFASHPNSATSTKETAKRDVKSAGSVGQYPQQYQQQQYYPYPQRPSGYGPNYLPVCPPTCPQYGPRPSVEKSKSYIVNPVPVYSQGSVYGQPEMSSKPTQVSPSTRTVSISNSHSRESVRSIYDTVEKNLEIHRTGCSCCDCRPVEDEPVEETKKQKSLCIYPVVEERNEPYFIQSEVLESISEVDCETDSSNLRSSSDECYCPETNSDEAQTSETRIITAKELEQLNLPGSVYGQS